MAAREHVQLVHGPNCGCIVHRHERATAAAKVQGTTPKLEPKLEPAVTLEPTPKVERAVKVRKAVSVVTPNAVPDVTPNSGKAGESRKRGRPRMLSDEQRREKVRQRVAGWRATRRKEKVQ